MYAYLQLVPQFYSMQDIQVAKICINLWGGHFIAVLTLNGEG
ncbi:hypothetical protein SPBRAN_581 [uncultured Candidatus Thioglobus sp.]|nr:hypothetical protein SPBRAN_581 [uncultured Candidatus Thioglobus sp.]